MDFTKYTVENEKINKGADRIRYNRAVSETYAQIYADHEEERFRNKATAVKYCFRYWDTEYYRIQAVKDIKRVNLCRDLFCPNCQHNLAQERERKYAPVLDLLRKDYGIFHAVFTVPNCSGFLLKTTINRMYSKFVYVNQYLQGKRKIKDVDLKYYGYVGSVRALEVSVNRAKTSAEMYHPHFHCIFLLKKGLNLDKTKLNRFSFDNSERRNAPTKFSDFEIFLQKFWYCLYNDIPTTKKNISDADGYSVKVEKCPAKKYHQVFKYAVGGLFKKGNVDILKNADDLYNLDNALHKRKMIQGYGAFRKLAFDDSETEEQKEKIYQMIRSDLLKFEEPVFAVQSLKEIQEDFHKHPEIKYISKNSIKTDNEKK